MNFNIPVLSRLTLAQSTQASIESNSSAKSRLELTDAWSDQLLQSKGSLVDLHAHKFIGTQKISLGQAQKSIPATDMQFERIAQLSYKDEFQPAQLKFIQSLGFNPVLSKSGEFIWKGERGLQMLVLESIEQGKSGLIAFRGSTMEDWLETNFNREGVGSEQFAANKTLISEALETVSGNEGLDVHVTGHSLGGALAVKALAEFPNRIARVVTFQSAGSSGKTMRDISPITQDKITNYIALNDPVSMTGEGIPGRTFIFDLQGADISSAHKVGLFGKLLKQPEHWQQEIGETTSSNFHNTLATVYFAKGCSSAHNRGFIESLRVSIGEFLSGVLDKMYVVWNEFFGGQREERGK